ncbi:MAG: hypothetical protein Q9O62_07425, partial [Ardenticatenia bacterium]|nr:hypothetical protein [Ardenticatenia bacterium]
RLARDGRLVLAESVPRRGQRLHHLLPWDKVSEDLRRRAVEAEEAIYADDQCWDVDVLEAVLRRLNTYRVQVNIRKVVSEVEITPSLVARWFRRHRTPPSYADALAQLLTPDEIRLVEGMFTEQVLGRTVAWTAIVAFVIVERAEPQDG